MPAGGGETREGIALREEMAVPRGLLPSTPPVGPRGFAGVAVEPVIAADISDGEWQREQEEAHCGSSSSSHDDDTEEPDVNDDYGDWYTESNYPADKLKEESVFIQML